jgi:beta-fructofuranosidase
MNDPNGLIQWKGAYHLFYQHNPFGAIWGNMHWGHATSRDLVHWGHLPFALAPTPGGPDKDGCFTGCAVDHDGVPTLVYTGVSPEVQCIATSADDLLTWSKEAGNPVIAGPPPGLDVTGFRDPYVWREGASWYMAVGSGLKGVGGMVLLYRSPDLRHWDYLQPLSVGQEAETGQIWECPNFFPLGERHVLIVSAVPLGKAIYFTGTYAAGQFTPQTPGVVDAGGHYYAPQTFRDAQGRRLIFGWLWEGRSQEAQVAAGWAGVMSLPRVLTLRDDGLLGMEPAPELRALRGKHHRLENVELSEEADQPLKDVRGDGLEIVAEFDVRGTEAQAMGLKVRCSPGGEEETLVAYSPGEARLYIDRERSSLSSDVQRGVHGGELRLAPQEPLRLHIFVDRSVVEVFANGRACVTSRVYPSREDSLGLALYAQGGRARLRAMDIWELGCEQHG